MLLQREKQPVFDLDTIDGSFAAKEYQQKVYDALMKQTAKERFEWLASWGWNRVSVERINNQTRCNWQKPNRSGEIKHPPINQTNALLRQIWWNMRTQGLFYPRGAARHFAQQQAPLTPQQQA